jgi:hypothetical protein
MPLVFARDKRASINLTREHCTRPCVALLAQVTFNKSW